MIALVGCGFLGSLLVEEIGKRWFAFNEGEPILLIDFDTFEERNCANQNVRRGDVQEAEEDGQKLFKVDHLGDILQGYNIVPILCTRKLLKENVNGLLTYMGEKPSLIVSALDNIPTRNLLWYYTKQHNIPLLTLGISQSGTGTVEWTWKNHDSYSLSPLATLGQAKKLASLSNVPKELKPCELIAFRGLGLNMAVAASKAIGIFKGFDPETVIGDPLPRTHLTVWDATNTGHSLREQVEITDE